MHLVLIYDYLENHFVIDDIIVIFSDIPGCRIYFTTDGSPPLPFMRSVNGTVKTRLYRGPFTLKYAGGRMRTVKAVAVSRYKIYLLLLITVLLELDYSLITG